LTPKVEPQPSRRDMLKWMTAGALTSLGSISLGSYETGYLSVERHELRLPNWDANGFKVALLADLHTNSPLEAIHAANAMRAAIAEKPDLIAIPGDFVNVGDHVHMAFVRQSLEPLRDAKCPVIATLGNHDYDCRNIQAVIDAVRSCSVNLLRNQAVEVDGVTVAGIDDGVWGKQRFDFLVQDDVSPSLLALFHEPDFVKYVPKFVSLQLSGHSHGGQVCLPGGQAIHTPFGAWEYVAGYYPDARVPLYVTRGVGTVGPRIRLFCRPEVTILTLRAG